MACAMEQFEVVSILKEAGATVMPRSLPLLLPPRVVFLASPPSHPNSARLRQPQGEAKSTPELEQAATVQTGSEPNGRRVPNECTHRNVDNLPT